MHDDDPPAYRSPRPWADLAAEAVARPVDRRHRRLTPGQRKRLGRNLAAYAGRQFGMTYGMLSDALGISRSTAKRACDKMSCVAEQA